VEGGFWKIKYFFASLARTFTSKNLQNKFIYSIEGASG
jgi:hypothetical protein